MEINPTAQIEQQIQVLTAGHELITCRTREEYDILIAQDNVAAGFIKQIGEHFNPDIKQASDLHKSLCQKKNKLIDPLQAFRSMVCNVTGGFLCQEQEEARKQAAALVKQAQKMGLDTSLIPQGKPKVEVGEGRTLVQTWTFDVVDEAKVPDKYWVIDLSKIKAKVTAFKDKTNIPGIKPRMETRSRRTGK